MFKRSDLAGGKRRSLPILGLLVLILMVPEWAGACLHDSAREPRLTGVRHDVGGSTAPRPHWFCQRPGTPAITEQYAPPAPRSVEHPDYLPATSLAVRRAIPLNARAPLMMVTRASVLAHHTLLMTSRLRL